VRLLTKNHPHRSSAEPSPQKTSRKSPGGVISIRQAGDILIGTYMSVSAEG